MAKVFIGMAVYNGEPYLQLALDSILGQTFSDFELIVIDDASTDHTGKILSEYNDPRIIIIFNENNLGQTVSLNKGLSIARGKYIARQFIGAFGKTFDLLGDVDFRVVANLPQVLDFRLQFRDRLLEIEKFQIDLLLLYGFICHYHAPHVP